MKFKIWSFLVKEWNLIISTILLFILFLLRSYLDKNALVFLMLGVCGLFIFLSIKNSDKQFCLSEFLKKYSSGYKTLKKAKDVHLNISLLREVVDEDSIYLNLSESHTALRWQVITSSDVDIYTGKTMEYKNIIFVLAKIRKNFSENEFFSESKIIISIDQVGQIRPVASILKILRFYKFLC